MVVSSRSPKACGKVIIYFELYARPFIILYSYPLLLQIFWRVVGMKGTLQVERGNQDGRHGYLVD